MQTLVMPPRLVDCDGDGRLDLVAVTVRTDALRGLTGAEATALEAQLNIFRGTGERFVLPALLTQTLRLPTDMRRGSRPFLHVVAASGGQPGEVLLREDEQLLRRPLQKDGERLRLGPPTAKVALPRDSQAIAPTGLGDEVLVLGDHELLHVRMR